jgi:polysaccharide deacetylase family protein (PEP-CTERM system associated)
MPDQRSQKNNLESTVPADKQTSGTGLRAAEKTSQRQHILTVAVEDWFQVGSFELLDEYDALATFFVLGWVADQMPEVVAEIASRGHEVASLGYHHRSIRGVSRSEFREDLLRAQEAIESASGQKLLGYRIADQWLGPKDLWALDVLAEEGYAYDSSVLSMFNRFSDEAYRRFVHRQSTPFGSILEVPPSSTRFMGCCLPIAGGNWFRQLPHTLLKRAVKKWDEKNVDPFVMYFHIWELDPDQPRISAADRLSKIRHYRNLDKMQWVLEDHLAMYRFGSVADRLGLKTRNVDRVESREPRVESISAARPGSFPKNDDPGPALAPRPCFHRHPLLQRRSVAAVPWKDARKTRCGIVRPLRSSVHPCRRSKFRQHVGNHAVGVWQQVKLHTRSARAE